MDFDASASAYAAVVYVSLINSVDPAHITLIDAKTTVAPLKTITSPRLKLCKLALLANLIREIIDKTIGILPTTTHAKILDS